MSGQEERDLVIRLNLYGWVIFCALVLTSLVYLPLDITVGVIVGGLLVTVNLYLLQRVVTRALRLGARVTPKSVLPRYYLCFLVTCLIIFIFISQHLVNGLGLLLGLSVFVLNVFLVAIELTAKIVYKTVTKEAV